MSSMFSNVEVRLLNSQGNSKAVAVGTVTVAERVQVSFTVLNSRNGPFVKLPQHKGKGKDKDGNIVDRWYNDVRFPEKDDYEAFQQTVLNAFNEVRNGQGAAGEESQVAPDDVPF